MTEHEEEERNNQCWLIIKDEILLAFKEVKLGDGIGYWEANALDDYLRPGSEAYEKEKAKDERNDWTKLLDEFGYDGMNSAAQFFMDDKGLHFFLPFLMIRQEDVVDYILAGLLREIMMPPDDQSSLTLLKLLTNEQKRTIWHFYQHMMIAEPWWSLHNILGRGGINFLNKEIDGFDFIEVMKMHFDVE